jgi:hypothetical protein
VSDGAGSAERSAEGSQLAVQKATRFLAERLRDVHPNSEEGWKALLEKTLKDVRAALEELAGTNLKALATTLLLAIATPEWLAIAQVGDGAIVGEFGFDELRVLTVWGKSEYINETVFVTSSEFLTEAHYAVATAQNLTGIVLFSDGMQMLALQSADNTAHKPFFVPLLEFASRPDSVVEELEEFLQSDRVCERTDDDKTLVVVVRGDVSRPKR